MSWTRRTTQRPVVGRSPDRPTAPTEGLTDTVVGRSPDRPTASTEGLTDFAESVRRSVARVGGSGDGSGLAHCCSTLRVGRGHDSESRAQYPDQCPGPQLVKSTWTDHWVLLRQTLWRTAAFGTRICTKRKRVNTLRRNPLAGAWCYHHTLFSTLSLSGTAPFSLVGGSPGLHVWKGCRVVYDPFSPEAIIGPSFRAGPEAPSTRLLPRGPSDPP